MKSRQRQILSTVNRSVFWLTLSTLWLAQSWAAHAHSNILGLEHFVTAQKTFVAYITSSDQPYEADSFGAFELGNGRRVYILGQNEQTFNGNSSIRKGDEAYPLLVAPGEVLAFVESQDQVSGKIVVAGQSQIKGLFIMTPESFTQLAKNPLNAIFAIDLQHPIVPAIKKQVSRVQQKELLRHRQFLSQEFLLDHERFVAMRRESPVNIERLLKDLRVLSGEASFNDDRNQGKSVTIQERGGDLGRDLTRQYLVQEFNTIGAQASTWCYTSGFRRGCNVIASLQNPGASSQSRTLVISSHLDSVQNAGADDNGSGTSALLELARTLKGEKLSINVVFIAFDQEELGLIGSNKIAPEIEEHIPGIFLANINTDMIGFDSDNDGAIHAMDCGRKDSAMLKQLAEKSLVAWQIPLNIINACTNRSDHSSFWKQEKPAFLLSENFFRGDSNTCYHKKCDKMNLINETYFANNVSLLYGMVSLLSEGNAEFQKISQKLK